MSSTTNTINFSCAEAVLPEKRHLTARSGMSALWWAMRQGILAARESRNTLPWLAPEKARELFDRWLRGEYAQIQWAWELMEKYDETLFAVKRARLAALQDMPWQIIIDADAAAADAARQQLAEAQKQYLNTLLGNVENLRAALRHLGAADFRGYAALEVCGTDERMRWETIEPWLLVRPSLAAPLMYNEKAEDSPAHPELLDSERVLLREAEPIDLPAMFLLTAKHHGTKAWDAFLDVFGIPSIFLETPPNTTEEQALEYQKKVEEIVGEGRGTIPNGAKFHTVETAQKETKSFQERADWCKDALLILATGGLLTITAQSGSGTLAGNAHADSFERLCAASAQDISEVVDFQFCRRKLMERFPGQPILAHFELAPQKEDDRAAQAQILATLAGAGFKPSAEVVSEMMGFEVTEAQPPQTSGMPVLNTAAPSVITNSASAPPAQDHLSEVELKALQSLASGGLTAEALHGTSQALADALQGAITNSEENDTLKDITDMLKDMEGDQDEVVANAANSPCRAKHPDRCPYHGGFYHPLVGKTGNAESLGLPGFETDSVKGERTMKPINHKLAEALIRGSIKVRAVDGDEVTFDGDVVDHWEGKDGSVKKSAREREKRLSRLADALRAVVHPHEIWLHHGKKVYVRKYETPTGKKIVMAGVVKSGNKTRTYYWDSPDEMLNVRQGRLLYYRS